MLTISTTQKPHNPSLNQTRNLTNTHPNRTLSQQHQPTPRKTLSSKKPLQQLKHTTTKNTHSTHQPTNPIG
jgi:hypothetical protein